MSDNFIFAEKPAHDWQSVNRKRYARLGGGHAWLIIKEGRITEIARVLFSESSNYVHCYVNWAHGSKEYYGASRRAANYDDALYFALRDAGITAPRGGIQNMDAYLRQLYSTCYKIAII